ncbi:type II toxin-antitoxin system prevent-host-death family antitoxin [Paraburkholderia caribensis]|uniref:type II toxin-antitoxin system prevent-host-death family antitoxin n=1 Tax=Paraburkholderia caribensis TaxID=75105 RepID=UPI001CC3AA17
MQAATDGPVYITVRGAPAYVLLSIEDDQRLQGEFVSLANARSGREANPLQTHDDSLKSLVLRTAVV